MSESYWMSPWRKGIRNKQPCIIADVAPTRAQRRHSVEVTFALSPENAALPDTEKHRLISEQVDEAVASFTRPAQ